MQNDFNEVNNYHKEMKIDKMTKTTNESEISEER